MVCSVTMDVHHLRVFLSVYRNRSFSKASRELRLSQPTISDHIKSLEQQLDCALFERLARAVIPTGEAEILYNHAVDIVEKTDNIRHALGNFKKEIAGELIIGASSIPGTYLLPSCMATFKLRNPSVSFQVLVTDSRDVVQKIAKHELLVGLVGSKLNTAHVGYVPFKEDELVVIASPALVKNSSLSVKQIAAYPFVTREEGSGTRREAERILAAHGVHQEALRLSAVFSSTDAVKQAVKAGLGLAIVSKLSIEQELRCGTLRVIRLKNVSMHRTFYIARHRKRVLPRLYQLFLEHLQTAPLSLT